VDKTSFDRRLVSLGEFVGSLIGLLGAVEEFMAVAMPGASADLNSTHQTSGTTSLAGVTKYSPRGDATSLPWGSTSGMGRSLDDRCLAFEELEGVEGLENESGSEVGSQKY
jgi:hypothetical protein